MIPRAPWLILAALVLAGAAGVQGYRLGMQANEAQHIAADLVTAKAEAAHKNKLLTAEADSRQFALAQEDEARAAPIENSRCFNADSVQRLKAFE